MVNAEKHQASTNKPPLKRFGRLHGISTWTILVIVLAVLFIFSFVLGRYPISPGDVLRVLASHIFPAYHFNSGIIGTIVMQIRLPRILAAMVVGASLALSGSLFKGFSAIPWSPLIFWVSVRAPASVRPWPSSFPATNWRSRYPPSASRCWLWAFLTASVK